MTEPKPSKPRPKPSSIEQTTQAFHLQETESDYSSDFDEEYQQDRYTFLEVGKVLNLKEPVFSEEDAALIVKNILIGLSHLHALNLVHRDIKPENIIILSKSMSETEPDTVGTDPEFTAR